MAISNHAFASPLRYPGGKGVLAPFMKAVVCQNQLHDGHYAELYAGGAGIAWSLLFEEYVRHVHINDLSRAIIAFWRSVCEHTDALCGLVSDTSVTLDEWHRQRYVQANFESYSVLEYGFSTFFLNRTNRSGILKGGVIGGKAQSGKWTIDVRFNKADLIARIQRIARYSDRIHIYNCDSAQFIQQKLPLLPQNTLVYLDPPYFVKGAGLYENHYTQRDHAEIACLVSGIKQPWLVSYDNVPQIVELYSDYRCITYDLSYSAQTQRVGSEVIFFSDRLVVPMANPNPARQTTLAMEAFASGAFRV